MSGFIARLRPRTLQAWRVSGGGPIYRKIGRHVAYAVSDASVGAGARSRPNAVVIVPEGEKAADAAGRLLPDHAVVTSANGSKSAGKADWTVLTGRRVVMWPHADAPSATAAGLFACNLDGDGRLMDGDSPFPHPPNSLKILMIEGVGRLGRPFFYIRGKRYQG